MSWRDRGWSRFPVYVPVAERQARSKKQATKLAGKGKTLTPVTLASRKIATTFWGTAWCNNLESYSDYANRLPRGRSYIRNGSVLHLSIQKGEIEALVSGSELYKIKIQIKAVPPATWKKLCSACAGSIGSLLELLGGKLSDRVMSIMTQRESGLFPSPKEITLDCSCPDWADMCKHVAAVLYGVGARLDEKPELLFLLRHVEHNDLVSQASTVKTITDKAVTAATVAASDIGDVFGIELAAAEPPAPPTAQKPTPARKPRTTARPSANRKKPAKKPRRAAKRVWPRG